MKAQQQQTYKGIRWQVIFSFLFIYLYHSVSGQLHYSVFEESRKGSVLGNIAKGLGLNVNDLSSRKFRIVSHVSEKYFAVNLENGNLYIKDRIDRETLCGSAATCTLNFEALVENPLNVFHVNVEIQDTNDNPPCFPDKIIEVKIIESALPGARFILQNAHDSDVGSNSLVSYKLSDNQQFTLGEKTSNDGSKTPELVLEKSLDHETQNIYELVLTASDAGNPVQTGTALIKIIITDSNDNFPVFSQDVYKISIHENMPINSSVLFVNATDKDEGSNAEISYFFKTISENAHNKFSINSKTGEVQTKAVIDFEEASYYEISVQAKDGGGLVTQSKVLIQVIDENDNAPQTSISSLFSPIPEDSPIGTVVALIKINDQDSGENGEVDCQITDKDTFKLIPSFGNYYKIITISAMDREKVPLYNITIKTTDKGFPALFNSKAITLEISDINDNPPVFDKSTYIAFITENNTPGASIFSIHASDEDINENAKLFYSIFNSDGEEVSVSSYLSINPVTGVLYAQRSFDYEQQKDFSLQIMARDNGSPYLNSNATLRICIVDQNDNAPMILYPAASETGSTLIEVVPHFSTEGSLVTKVVAVDEDSGHNAFLSYHFIQSSETTLFTIDYRTGEIKTACAFHEKDTFRQKVVIMVKDNGNPYLSATVILHLVVTDNFHEILPDISNRVNNIDSQSDLQVYLIIALALISFLFILTILIVIISRCKLSKSSTNFSSLNTNLYSQVDPRFLSQYNNGTLSLPYSYNVCVALDSNESNFTFRKPAQNIPVENLIDADSEIGKESSSDQVCVNFLLNVIDFRLHKHV
ncbi:protocadherin gamma-B2-like [Bombina bombina]|uniref:protocadherin gamma-B2-like n=1 Tax=Bombina bombina TaxID=8345 RepID=UPI00235A7FED|nr:protocadherin gamma-B2-like [Bombina bombina]